MASTWMFNSLVVVVAMIFASVEVDCRLVRVKRIVCAGRLVEVNEVCRWSDFECACVADAFCSQATNVCEVCRSPSGNCTSRCPYECLNGGQCDQATSTCVCRPGFHGADCGSPAWPEPPAMLSTERPRVPATSASAACGLRKCLNGGTCRRGVNGDTCACPVGYYLPDCSLCLPRVHPRKCLDHCDVVCDRGDCLTEHRKCHCSLDYMGEDCSLCIPSVAHGNCTAYCSPMCRHGATCNTATSKCQCAAGWRGESCQEACPRGTFGPNCLQRCACVTGNCDPATGQCLCGRGEFAEDKDNCKSACDCLVHGVCYPKNSCPDGKAPVPATTPAISATTASGNLQSKTKDKSTGDDGQPSMMMLAIVTSGGVVVLLIVVVVLVVCLARSRRERTRCRKPGRAEEVERVPARMTVSYSANVYDDASSMPMLTAQPTAPPSCRPTSGYEDVRDLQSNLPDLLPPSSSGDAASPYATADGAVTIHADGGSPLYAYASLDELKTTREAGEAAASSKTGAYNNVDARNGQTPQGSPAVDAVYSSVQDEDSYQDASSRGSLGHLVDADTSGYAKMSPSTRKALSLKSPPSRKDGRREPVQRKAASLKLSRSEGSDKHGPRETYENGYVGFDPEGSASGTRRKPSASDPPPPPSPDSIPRQQEPVLASATRMPSAKGTIPHYAKPNKGGTKPPNNPKPAIPHYAKPNKPKNVPVPQYAQPDKVLNNMPALSEDRPYDQLERPHGAGKGKSTPGAGYAHLMHAVSPPPRSNVYEYPTNE